MATKTLNDGLTQVRSFLGTHVDSGSKGLYDDPTITYALNLIQRCIAKSFPEELLATLITQSTHPFTTTAMIPSCFEKSSAGNGRVLNLGLGIDFADEIPIKSRSEWMRWGKLNSIPGSTRSSYVACEIGTRVYIRPYVFTANTDVVEVYVADTTNMTVSSSKFSIPDHLFDVCCLTAAWFLANQRRDVDLAATLKSLLDGTSAMLSHQWNVAIPDITEQVEATNK